MSEVSVVCAVAGCSNQGTEGSSFMCASHWSKVPSDLQLTLQVQYVHRDDVLRSIQRVHQACVQAVGK